MCHRFHCPMPIGNTLPIKPNAKSHRANSTCRPCMAKFTITCGDSHDRLRITSATKLTFAPFSSREIVLVELLALTGSFRHFSVHRRSCVDNSFGVKDTKYQRTRAISTSRISKTATMASTILWRGRCSSDSPNSPASLRLRTRTFAHSTLVTWSHTSLNRTFSTICPISKHCGSILIVPAYFQRCLLCIWGTGGAESDL